jgi:hypothetical protein
MPIDRATGQPLAPVPPQGWLARLEFSLRARGWRRLPNLLGRWDERGLGR